MTMPGSLCCSARLSRRSGGLEIRTRDRDRVKGEKERGNGVATARSEERHAKGAALGVLFTCPRPNTVEC